MDHQCAGDQAGSADAAQSAICNRVAGSPRLPGHIAMRKTETGMLNVKCLMLNDLPIQHSTFNIQHSSSAIKPGAQMPPNQLSATELQDLLAYLDTLQ